MSHENYETLQNPKSNQSGNLRNERNSNCLVSGHFVGKAVRF